VVHGSTELHTIIGASSDLEYGIETNPSSSLVGSLACLMGARIVRMRGSQVGV
jgi:hypothetical protein